MEQLPRPAPVVRVRDPRAPRTAPPASPQPHAAVAGGPVPRRGVRPVVLLLLGVAVGAGAAELRHVQRDRAAAAAAAGVLDLRLEAGQGLVGLQVEGSASGTRLRRELAVRNVGGRPVRVLDATLGGGAMHGGASPDLPHGEAWQLVLAGEVRCSAGGPAYAPPGSLLRVRAQTDAGERTADLAVPAHVLAELQGQAERACGVVPPGESVQARPLGVRVGQDSVTVDVGVLVASAAPVDLLRVESGRPGLRVAVRTRGRPPVFPFRLASGGTSPRLDDGRPVLSSGFQAVITVEDCDQVQDAAGAPDGDRPLLRLAVQVGDASGEGVAEVRDPGGVDQLVARTC